MTSRTSLKISARKADEKLTPDQERFRYLLAQLEKVRKARADWEKEVLEFRRAETQQLQPLRESFTSTLRDTVIVVDAALEQKRWSRLDRQSLEELLTGIAQMLLENNAADPELQAIFDRHSSLSFAESKRAKFEDLKREAEEMMGVELDDESVRNEDDLAQRMYEHMAQKREREEARASRRGKSAAQQRVEANAQAAKLSLREMYRKLASAVHPDREPDAARRAEKNELMQTINRAYAANDLLTLLEAQVRLEQIDPDHVDKVSAERLAQYNKLLATQLSGERKAIEDMQMGFRMDFGLEGEGPLAPKRLTMIIRERARRLRAEIEQQKQFLLVLRDSAATKRWLKMQRSASRGRFVDLDDDF
jgi:hypothetical protein